MEEEPNVDALQKALGKLVTEGLVPYNVGENGGLLLELGIVQARRKPLDGKATEAERDEADTDALASVLSEAVEHPTIKNKLRRLLHYVLPLEPTLVGSAIKDRRTEAGKNIKPGKKIKPGTIRTYYEPKALEKLAEALHRMEHAFRARATSDGESEGPRDPDE